jgi:hypothetical protein
METENYTHLGRIYSPRVGCDQRQRKSLCRSGGKTPRRGSAIVPINLVGPSACHTLLADGAFFLLREGTGWTAFPVGNSIPTFLYTAPPLPARVSWHSEATRLDDNGLKGRMAHGEQHNLQMRTVDAQRRISVERLDGRRCSRLKRLRNGAWREERKYRSAIWHTCHNQHHLHPFADQSALGKILADGAGRGIVTVTMIGCYDAVADIAPKVSGTGEA